MKSERKSLIEMKRKAHESLKNKLLLNAKFYYLIFNAGVLISLLSRNVMLIKKFY